MSVAPPFFPIHVINLVRAPERKEAFLRNNAHLPCNFFPAFDGDALEPAVLNSPALFRHPLPFPGLGAFGCALSHFALWKLALRLNQPITIAEDDVLFREDFVEASAKVVALLPEDWDLVYWSWNFDAPLAVRLIGDRAPAVMAFDQRSVVAQIDAFRQSRRPSTVLRLDKCYGTPAYAITPRGAQKFIDLCFPIEDRKVVFPLTNKSYLMTGIDMAMSQAFPKTQSYVAFPPLALSPNDHATSSVQKVQFPSITLGAVDPPVTLREQHFQHQPEREQARQLFAQSVRFVEIEIHSFCNRQCSFCGNSLIDRRSHRVLMDPRLYSKIIDDLAEIDYRGVIWYSRYNEPCSDRELFLDRLREARAKLPQALLQTFTNGDYITAEYIEAMRDAGLNRLSIMTYLDKNQEPSFENFSSTMLRRVEKLGVAWSHEQPNRIRLAIDGIDATYNFDDFLKTGTNRGGALETGNIVQRVAPCTIPITDVYIDHNGSMVPCCDIRSDYEPHKNMVVYTLTPDNSIFEGYANSRLVQWRRTLARFGTKDFPCESCCRRQHDATEENFKLFGALADAIDKVKIDAESVAQ